MSHRQTGDFATAKPRLLLIFWLLLGLGGLWASSSMAGAAEETARIESVQIGFRGVVEAGRWSPITIQVVGRSGTEVQPRITSVDVEGRPVRQPGQPVVLKEGTNTISAVYQHGRINSSVVVELVQGDTVLDEVTQHISPDNTALRAVTQLTDFVLCLGESQPGFEQAAQVASTIRMTRPDRVAPMLVQAYTAEQLGELPLVARGWESVDVCVIAPECDIPEPLGQVLRQWVHHGGRILMVGGEQVTSTNSPGLVNWLPVRLDGSLTFRDITSLNSAIEGSATLRLREGSLRAVRWMSNSAADLSPNLDGPLVIRSGESLGTVTAVALNINDLPFVRKNGDERSIAWDSLPDLCRWLAGLAPIPKLEEGATRPQSDLNPTGVSDLQTQLVNTLDRFPEITRPSYWVVLGSILLFLLVAGPLDYLLVHKVLQRPHWTWVTLPIWIALGTCVGLSASTRTGGTQNLTRQLDLVTLDTSQGEAHLDSWLSIYSVNHHRFEVACRPGTMTAEVSVPARMRWGGRPEAGFRGLYRSTSGSSSGSGASIEQSADQLAFLSLPIRHGASAVLEAKATWEEAPQITNELFDTGDGHLRGSFAHQYPGELVDWVLAYKSFAYMPIRSRDGVDLPLAPGQTIRADQVPSRILVDYLVRLGTRAIDRKDLKGKGKEYSLSREGYDPLSRDLHLLLRTLTFHDVVDGQAYTGLTNSTLQAEDLTRLIGSERAVVFGRWRNTAYQDPADTHTSADAGKEQLAAQYTMDGQPLSPRYRECFVRWILPVRQGPAPAASP